MSAEQLGFDQMPTPLRAVTPAKVEMFDACPRRFRYTYIDRPTPPRGAPWAHTGIGAAVHTALRMIWDHPVERRTAAQLTADLRSQWPAVGFRDQAQSRNALRIVSEWISRYLEECVDVTHEPRGIERTVGAPYDTLSISGRVDRIDQYDTADGPVLHIVDYKTGRHVPTEDEVRSSAQLAMYAVAAERTLRTPCVRVELHHIPSATVVGADLSPQTRSRQLRRIGYTADDIEQAKGQLDDGTAADEAYPARPGPACGWCDFWAHCAPGRAAALKRDPWFAVPGEPTRDG